MTLALRSPFLDGNQLLFPRQISQSTHARSYTKVGKLLNSLKTNSPDLTYFRSPLPLGFLQF